MRNLDYDLAGLLTASESMAGKAEATLLRKHGLPIVHGIPYNGNVNFSLRRYSGHTKSFSWLIKAILNLSDNNKESYSEQRIDEEGVRETALLYKNTATRKTAHSLTLLFLQGDNNFKESKDLRSGLEQLLETL